MMPTVWAWGELAMNDSLLDILLYVIVGGGGKIKQGKTHHWTSVAENTVFTAWTVYLFSLSFAAFVDRLLSSFFPRLPPLFSRSSVEGPTVTIEEERQREEEQENGKK